MEYEVKTDVFTIDGFSWHVRIGEEVLTATWNSKGAATAGLETECRRKGIHKISRDCWCKPVVSKD